jgi:hypothetical protein
MGVLRNSRCKMISQMFPEATDDGGGKIQLTGPSHNIYHDGMVMPMSRQTAFLSCLTDNDRCRACFLTKFKNRYRS